MFSLRVICGILLAQSYVFAVSNTDSRTCDSPIYCEGPLLHTVQLAKLYPDSKTFVDMVNSVLQ